MSRQASRTRPFPQYRCGEICFSVPFWSTTKTTIASSKFLRPEDFYLDAHRVIFRHMIALDGEARGPSTRSRSRKNCCGRHQLESAGGIGYLAGLLDGIPHLVNIEHYIEIIREKSLFRQMINSANKIMAECFDQAEPADADPGSGRAGAVQSVRAPDESRICLRSGTWRSPTTQLLTKLYKSKEMITGVRDRVHGSRPHDFGLAAGRSRDSCGASLDGKDRAAL